MNASRLDPATLPVIIDPATRCSTLQMNCPWNADEFHWMWTGDFLAERDGRCRQLHNVASQMTIPDADMNELLRGHWADITCSHHRSGIYDGVEYPQYCKDEILVLRLHASNGEWRYKRIDRNSWGAGKTVWRWPD